MGFQQHLAAKASAVDTLFMLPQREVLAAGALPVLLQKSSNGGNWVLAGSLPPAFDPGCVVLAHRWKRLPTAVLKSFQSLPVLYCLRMSSVYSVSLHSWTISSPFL